MGRPTALAMIAGLLLTAQSAVTSCSSPSSRLVGDVDTVAVYRVHYDLPDTLRVGTLYSPTSYFIYREEKMGYDYDLVSRFAADKGMVLKLEVATSMASMVEMLEAGEIDMIAYEIPITSEYKDRMVHCGIERITTQVLVQPKNAKGGSISDVTQLVGRDVYVEKDSKYQQRLSNLNDELGGGIKIHAIDRDTLITEDLIEMVSKGTIPLTVVDSDIAGINKTYYNDLDIGMDISYPQRASWAVARNMSWLADTVDVWTEQENPRRAQADLLKQYFEKSKDDRPVFKLDFSSGKASPFDPLFKRYAAQIGWDWRMIAAQAYVESRFDSSQVSWAGARGIMQIMPATAKAHGLSADRITNNEASIATAVKIIKELDGQLKAKVPDPEERKKFIIAAYNSGIAHILDAIALAEKHGMDPRRWHGNVAQALLMKSKPEYYNDPVCRYGYFRGRQTFDYVINVYDFYNQCKARISR